MSTPERPIDSEPVFTTGSYLYEMLALRQVILSLPDEETKEKIKQHIFNLQDLLRPVVEEYLSAHPEADHRASMFDDLYNSPLTWLTED